MREFSTFRALSAGRFLGALRRGWVFLLLLTLCSSAPAWAIRGAVGAHDPSNIIKDGNKYWVFTTGVGIPSLYSTDMLNWTAAPRPVFTAATKPSWIATKVPGFVDTYWAPECIYMNGKFYLYYSCSTFGSKVSGIGLATNVTLDPTSPNYNWVDEGEVISSNNNSAANAIDPAVYRDAANNLWFTYGSFFGGIRILQLDPATGKPLANATQFAVANGGVEAAYVKQHGSYYYLFINRGNCCQGSNSTYYIQVGRSTSPSGPFLDKNGVNLNNNGGSVVLSTSGRYVGPGHAGVFEENGVSYFSHHYYDLDNGGAAKLDVAKLTWDAAGWPVVSRNWLTPGRYTISNPTSSLLWTSAGCNSAVGQGVLQNPGSGQPCQQWDLTLIGEATYQLSTVDGAVAVGTRNCSSATGTPLQLESSSGSVCQEFQLERASDGSFVFGFFNRVVEAAGGSGSAGTALQLGLYNPASPAQRWTTTATGPLASAAGQRLVGVSIYPVPAQGQGFTVALGSQPTAEATVVEVYDVRGQRVHRQPFDKQLAKLVVTTALRPGVYLVRVSRSSGTFTQKISIQ
ncbi:family 43 glycosylhydrolase [Hymenobacter metallicola]|uniref:T9SS type A sorting domain-containing protein n=1 Tax=Hymenobacter metallicola TaxID=2563114 RepID=A0A4Z0QGL5_9BACT|nr:family 43 glycosylhydrolase [Hymenobacter metallicola]TGE29170.1 T9SS type A sorting domain-containing protein [Hymenobacter metallicola]